MFWGGYFYWCIHENTVIAQLKSITGILITFNLVIGLAILMTKYGKTKLKEWLWRWQPYRVAYQRARYSVRVNYLFMSQDEAQINSIKGRQFGFRPPPARVLPAAKNKEQETPLSTAGAIFANKYDLSSIPVWTTPWCSIHRPFSTICDGYRVSTRQLRRRNL